MPEEWLWFSLSAPTTKANHDRPASVNAYSFTLIVMSFMEELPQRNYVKVIKSGWSVGAVVVISEKERASFY